MRAAQWTSLLTMAAAMMFASTAQAARFEEVTRPIDAYEQTAGGSLDQIPTLLDRVDTEGMFPLGRELTTIGRADLTGVAFNANTFKQNPLEGAYDATVSYNTFEQPVGVSSRREDLQKTIAARQGTRPGNNSRIVSNRVSRVSVRQ